jgi:hypothetical protein
LGVTKVGPADKSDLPRKKGFWHRALRFLHIVSGLAWISQVFWFLPGRSTGRAIDSVTRDDEPGSHYHPPPGIPEADLSDEQREAAAERMKREDAIRRAKGER